MSKQNYKKRIMTGQARSIEEVKAKLAGMRSNHGRRDGIGCQTLVHSGQGTFDRSTGKFKVTVVVSSGSEKAVRMLLRHL